MIPRASFADHSVFVHRVLLGGVDKAFYAPLLPYYALFLWGFLFFYDTTVDYHYINEKYGHTPPGYTYFYYCTPCDSKGFRFRK